MISNMASVKLLVEEIDKIATAPYLVDIAPLHTIVCNVGDQAIRQWCCAKSCQIPKLASYLVKFLFEDRGLEVFERFCRVETFAKAVSCTYPSILPKFLSQAISDDERSKANVLCSRLLASHPVQGSGIPADLPRYLEKLMRAINQFPIAEPLHAMREIVAQQTAGALELVSQNVLADFINACKRLTKDSPSHWHEAAIISINISSAVCDEVFFKAPGYPKDMANPTCSDVLCEWACKLLRHFDGLKAPRVLHSIVARVMFFTSKNQNIPMSTRERTLDIVAETLDRFRYGIKEWSIENADAVDKVWRSASGEHLKFDARLSAFAVAYKISQESSCCHNRVEAVLEQLVPALVSEDEPCTIFLLDRAGLKARKVTDALCYLLQQEERKPCLESMMRSIVVFILTQCRACQTPDLNTYSKTRTAAVLLQALAESVKGQEVAFSILLAILEKNESPERAPSLKDLAGGRSPVPNANCRGSPTCVWDASRLRDQLRHDFSVCLLHGACTTKTTLSDREFVFLQDKAFSCKPEGETKSWKYPADADSFPFIPPAPVLPPAQGDWRARLLQTMMEHQNESAEAIFEHINIVCKDMETRCQNVEAPLRDAEAHALQLNDELDRVRTRLDLVETTKNATMQALEEANDAIRDKDNQLTTLQQALEKAYEAAIERDSNNVALQKTLDSTNDSNLEKDNSIIALQQALNSANKINIEKASENSILEQEAGVLRIQAEGQKNEILRQKEHFTSLQQGHEKQLNDLRAEALDTKRDLERLNHADRLVFEDEIENEKQHIEKLAATITWLESERQKVLNEQQADLQAYEEKLQQITGEHQESYDDVAKQSEQLRNELNARDGENLKLQEAINEKNAELRQDSDRIKSLVQLEQEWLQERKQLMTRLGKAEAKEKKVLAAIQGLDSNSQASVTTSLEGVHDSIVNGREGEGPALSNENDYSEITSTE